MPLSIRLDSDLQALLSEGAQRTPLNKRELLRRTLRLYLREVIEQEAIRKSEGRITNIEPWPSGALAKAYGRPDEGGERAEVGASASQGWASWED